MAQTPFSHSGFGGNHGTYSPLPGEHVDPASGTLLLSETDLVLPGNAGLDLVVRRFYNSGVRPGFNEGDMFVHEDAWTGVGWTLHFGRVLLAERLEPGVTKIEMSDGSRHPLHTTTAFPEGWVTSDLWRFDRTTNELKMPNGLTYTFGHLVYINPRFGWARYVTEIKDQFNNRITFGYFAEPGPPDGVAWAHQYLGSVDGVPQERHVTFTYGPSKGLQTMQYLDRTWTYTHELLADDISLLKKVQPPVGPPTVYDYTSGYSGELTGITTPSGGVITYGYEQRTRRAGPLSIEARVVTLRTVAGHEVPASTWTFTYGAGPNQDTTIVDCACGRTTYRFVGTGLAGDFSAWGSGALAEQTVEQGGVVLERQIFEWEKSAAISPDPVEGNDGVWSDAAIHRPLLKKHTTTRGTQSWSTQFTYNTGSFNDYGQPYQIVEAGDTTRTTVRQFTTGFSFYLAPQVSSQTVTVGSTSYTTNRTIDLSTGWVSQVSGLGATQQFEPTAAGNLHAVVDGRSKRTTYQYSWGALLGVHTPTTNTWFELYEDGNTFRSHAVTDVDELVTTTVYTKGRLTSVQPPGVTNPVLYTYDDSDGHWAHTARGTAQAHSEVDGFGRVWRTSSSTGVKSRVVRDVNRTGFFGGLILREDGAHGTIQQVRAGVA